MKRVYADNAATSFPKPSEVSKAMCNYIDNIGGNVGRGTYESAYAAARVVYETRELISKLFNFPHSLNVVFTANITESLNTIIKGFLKPGDGIIVSSMEHNAVMRPLSSKALTGIEITRLQCEEDGTFPLNILERNIKNNTKLVVITHASNVCGTIMPVKEVGKICKKYGIHFVLDAAQSAGVLDLDFQKLNLSALAFTGHKGLLGPQGIGGFLINKDFEQLINPLKEGGTGSFSDAEVQPEILPDKFECGTLNTPGIYGLNAALKYIEHKGIENIRVFEEELSKDFLNKVLNIDEISLSGIKNTIGRTSVFSINFTTIDNAEAAFILDREFGIMTRVGLHCSPAAHKTLGTFPSGSVRFSFGSFNDIEEIDYVASSILKTIKMLKH